mmetsp:Transcript_4013/g.11824  ORF Transcript_4013/g.11824 Transcript_4013/m.11824 type:complete len:209 (+) Transcript_4013:398-1024(+)
MVGAAKRRGPRARAAGARDGPATPQGRQGLGPLPPAACGAHFYFVGTVAVVRRRVSEVRREERRRAVPHPGPRLARRHVAEARGESRQAAGGERRRAGQRGPAAPDVLPRGRPRLRERAPRDQARVRRSRGPTRRRRRPGVRARGARGQGARPGRQETPPELPAPGRHVPRGLLPVPGGRLAVREAPVRRAPRGLRARRRERRRALGV